MRDRAFRRRLKPLPRLGLLLSLATTSQLAVAEEPTESTESSESSSESTSKREHKANSKREHKANSKREHEANGKREHKAGVKLKAEVVGMAAVTHRRDRVVDLDLKEVDRNVNALDLTVKRARVTAELQSPLPWLTGQVEFEVAHKPLLRDAYVQAGERFYLRVGQMKLPASTLEMEAAWKVPLARRDVLHDVATDWLDVAGRQPGILLGYRNKSGLKPRLMLGAFQGTTLKAVAPGERDVALIDKVSLSAQTFAARAEIAPGGFTLGAWYEHRVGSPTFLQVSHYQTFGADLSFDKKLGRGALRAWLDGMGGESLYATSDPSSSGRAWFAGARALLGYRYPQVDVGQGYVEPFALAGALDPDARVKRDLLGQVSLGVAAGFWDRARLAFQLELTRAERNLPSAIFYSRSPDQLSWLLAAGARF